MNTILDSSRLGQAIASGWSLSGLVRVALAIAVAACCVWPLAALSVELQSTTFVPDLEFLAPPNASKAQLAEVRAHPFFVQTAYTVVCEPQERCRMRFEMVGQVVAETTLARSPSLLKEVDALLQQVKQEGYRRASRDTDYKLLDGLRPVDCWRSGDSGQAGSLCRFEAPNGGVKWVVLWGDMCSATCYSGFAPFYVVPQK